MLTLNARPETRQTQTLSPRLQHAVRLLQMSSLEFSALVRAALDSNPFLESEDEVSDPAQPEAPPAEADPRLQPAEPDFGESDNDRDLWHADGRAGSPPADEGEGSVLETMAADTALNSHLHTQLNVLSLPQRDLLLARTIVESLDDDGYLRTPLDELIGVAALDPAASMQEMQIALKRVQALDPSGVGARNVGECLRLQLHEIDCPSMRGMAQAIVDEHLDELAARDVESIARALGASVAQVEGVCDRLRRLDPRPGWRHGSSQVAYVVPDVIVKKVRGHWVVQLNPAVVPRVRLNQVYAQLFQRHRTAHDAELGANLQEARWTVRNVEQRFSTIVDVARAIVERQRHFLDYGAMAMKPMGLREIAEDVGVHESTVSRVTNNKYMATPNGVFELKYFFSRAMISANGSTCSGTAIRGLIRDVIAGEQAQAPLSDAEITRQLAQQGLVVARRTVTKYRQMLKIEPVDRRRRHA